MSNVIEEPKGLAEVFRTWWRQKKNRVWVMNFLNFSGSVARERYEAHLSEQETQCGLRAHLFSKITSVSKLESRHEPVEDAEKADMFALLSFPGEKEYASFLLSEEHRNLVKWAEKEGEAVSRKALGTVEESMILTKELRLPPKNQVIDRLGWEHGNPYEPFGEDFFGK